MAHKRGTVAKQDAVARQDRERLAIQRTERERGGLAVLEEEPPSDAPPPVGPLADDDPVREDEEEGDTLLLDDDAGPADASEPPPDDDPDGGAPAPRVWTRRFLLGSRPEAVLVRLADGPDGLKALLTLKPRERTKEALKGLCDLLEDRFGPEGAARFKPEEWEQVIGRRAARPSQRLILLQRLATTGDAPFRRQDGTQTTPNNLGLANFRRKFAVFPDGVPFSVGLLLTGGQSGRKEAGAADHPFARMPLTLRLMVLSRALRRERAEGWIRKDGDFRELLRDAAVALTGIDMEALPTESVRRLREALARQGLGGLFPKASERRASVGGAAESGDAE